MRISDWSSDVCSSDLCVVALLVVFGICFYFAQPFFAYLAQPLADVMLEHGLAEPQRRLIFTALTEVFFTSVMVALFAAAFICFPVFLTPLCRLDRRRDVSGRRVAVRVYLGGRRRIQQ